MLIIETGAELYRELKKRGLHLRKENGRDNKLLILLANKLRCESNKIQDYLDNSDVTAETFLLCFMEVTEPFSKMYQEIWKFLSDYKAPNVTESLSVRFGFENDDRKVAIDLDTFREQITRITNLTTSELNIEWPYEALSHLFQVSQILLRDVAGLSLNSKYIPGDSMQLPIPQVASHSFDPIIVKIRDLFQKIIDNSKNIDRARTEKSYILTDLMPAWHYVFDNTEKISDVGKSQAFDYYQSNIEPLIDSQRKIKQQIIRDTLDILNLPFWRHRWHMYEVWCTVKALQALKVYNPVLKIIGGRIPIDGYEAGIIAGLHSEGFPEACVGVQYQTAFVKDKRKGIKPDLRVWFNQKVDDTENAALVIEYKQHKNLNRTYIKEIMEAYTQGCPNSGGVIVVNYDNLDGDPDCPPGATLLTEFHPSNASVLSHFDKAVFEGLTKAGFRIKAAKILLLDVSGSMLGRYDKIVNVLAKLDKRSDIEIIHFNFRITENEMEEAYLPKVRGGTDRSNALKELYQIKGHLREVLIVSDEILSVNTTPYIDNIYECFPDDLPNFLKDLEW